MTILTAHLSEQSRFVESVESMLQEYAVQDTAEEKKLASLVAQIEAKEIERKVLILLYVVQLLLSVIDFSGLCVLECGGKVKTRPRSGKEPGRSNLRIT